MRMQMSNVWSADVAADPNANPYLDPNINLTLTLTLTLSVPVTSADKSVHYFNTFYILHVQYPHRCNDRACILCLCFDWKVIFFNWFRLLYYIFVVGQASFLTKKLNIAGRRATLSIWDTAGQERFHALGPIYYRDSNGAILVYDITDEDSFQKVCRSY